MQHPQRTRTQALVADENVKAYKAKWYKVLWEQETLENTPELAWNGEETTTEPQVAVEVDEVPTLDNTAKEIKAYLKSKGIDYGKLIKKSDLLDLI